ncbi:MAG: ATP-binding protein, partial [Prevotella sp.]
FSSLAQKKGINLDFSADEGECIVKVDVKKLERMVYNLLGNSIKFTPQGGKISLQSTHTDEALTISVGDTGSGIDKEDLNKIFERFYQIGNNSDEGTGIGLALVKKYAELMGGRVEIESNTANDNAGNTGTRISIIIPTSSTNDSTNDATAPTAAITNNLSPDNLLACSNMPSAVIENEQHITEEETRPVAMVIDDNADMRSFISSLLSDKYRVLTAVNGEQGLQMATENVPDIVICDVMMPVMDGLECCKRLKNDVCTSHIPVILLTACSLDEQRVSGLQSGAEAYIAKPFNSSVLLAQIDTLLKNRVRVNLSKATVDKPKSEKKEASLVIDLHSDDPSLSRYDRGFLKKIHENVESNYGDENFSVEILADKMCLSRTQLYRKCKALTGITPVELIRNTRLEHAREMLLNGYESISNVATAVGIPNATYFTKCYKAYFGDYPKNTMS